MLKVTLLAGALFLNILLFNGCNQAPGSNRDEIRYENKLDSLYERKIDSAYARITRTCDSTLAARWKVLEDSILASHHLLDSLVADSVGRARHLSDSLAHAKHLPAAHTRPRHRPH